MKAILIVDGACHPNPGAAGYAWVIYLNNQAYRSLSTMYGYGTNNSAEYNGIWSGLKEFSRMMTAREPIWNKIDSIEVRTDSKLAVEQLKGNYRVKSDLIQFVKGIKTEVELLKKSVEFIWTPETQVAHDLAEALYNISPLPIKEESNAKEANNNPC